MLSVRNGTAVAIVLSIAFVLVAVAGRDQIPGFANDNGNSATSTTNQTDGADQAANTASDVQIGQSEALGIGTGEAAQESSWDGEYDDDDHDSDYHDHDDDHHDDDDDHDDD